MLRGLTAIVVVVVIAGAVAEVLVPPMVEARVEEAVHEHTSGAATVDAEAGSFPFVPGLLLDGTVDRLDVTLREVADQRITIGTVALRLDGIHLDRRQLLAGTLEVVDVDRGRVQVEIAESEIVDALGVGDLDSRMVDMARRGLEIAADGRSLEVPVPEGLLPCTPEVETTEAGVRLRCEFEGVPDVLSGRTLG